MFFEAITALRITKPKLSSCKCTFVKVYNIVSSPRLPVMSYNWSFIHYFLFSHQNTLESFSNVFFSIPDCRKEKFARLFVATFVVAIVWISVYSYMMVWMITVIGFTLAIPDTVMGLTFIAAGVSVPDALSGIAVVKEGGLWAKIVVDEHLY